MGGLKWDPANGEPKHKVQGSGVGPSPEIHLALHNSASGAGMVLLWQSWLHQKTEYSVMSDTWGHLWVGHGGTWTRGKGGGGGDVRRYERQG